MTRRNAAIGLVLIIVVLGVVMLVRRTPPAAPTVVAVPAVPERLPEARPVAPAPVALPSAVAPTAPAGGGVPSLPAADPTGVVDQVVAELPYLLKADDIVATVAGQPLRARDICVYGAKSGSEVQAFSPADFDALVERAIRKILAFNAAAKAGIALNDDQKANLEQVRATVRQRQGGDENAVFLTIRGTVDEQVAFEMKDAEAMLLQNTLLEQAGVRSPYVTEADVTAYYAQHVGDYASLPEDPVEQAAAWTVIDASIRQTLSPVVMAQYEASRRAYFDKLAAEAGVQVNEPASAP